MGFGFEIRKLSLLLGLVAALFCSSCLFSRLFLFKRQLASFDKYVEVSGGGNSLAFRQPVVKAGDITSLTGFEPSCIETQAEGGEIQVYRYRNVAPAGLTGMPGVLCFTLRYSSGLLSSFDYPPVITQVLGTNFVVAAAKAVGQSSFNQRKYMLDWSTESTNLQALIPSLEKTRLVFGPAVTMSNTTAGTVATYVFNLEGPDGCLNTNGVMHSVLTFDPFNLMLRKGLVRLGRIELAVELPAVR